MKKIAALALCAALLLSACTPAGPAPDDTGSISGSTVKELPTARQVARAALDACGQDAAELERVDRMLDEEGLAAYLTGFYGLPEDSWSDCAIYRAGGAEILEVAAVRLTDGANTGAVQKGLEDYITGREGDFTGYAPAQAAIAAQALALCREDYAVLLLCPDAQSAREAVEVLLDGRALPPEPEPDVSDPEPAPGMSLTPGPEPGPAVEDPPAQPDDGPARPVSYPGRVDYVQPGIDDMSLYDTSAILAAWDSGDPSALSEKDRAIYDRCLQVLDKAGIDGDMAALDRERAIYRWLTANVRYDRDHYDLLAHMDPDSYGPYGPLLNGKGVCLGYATTFQLLMDLCEVECITVVGAAFRSREDHAWNMVRLDGIWYCVDATWDAGTPERFWLYFNVSSDHMALTDHQWDYESVPETD